MRKTGRAPGHHERDEADKHAPKEIPLYIAEIEEALTSSNLQVQCLGKHCKTAATLDSNRHPKCLTWAKYLHPLLEWTGRGWHFSLSDMPDMPIR